MASLLVLNSICFIFSMWHTYINNNHNISMHYERSGCSFKIFFHYNYVSSLPLFLCVQKAWKSWRGNLFSFHLWTTIWRTKCECCEKFTFTISINFKSFVFNYCGEWRYSGHAAKNARIWLTHLSLRHQSFWKYLTRFGHFMYFIGFPVHTFRCFSTKTNRCINYKKLEKLI